MGTLIQSARKRSMLIGLGAIAILGFCFWYVSHRNVSSANGIYYNACCGLVVIKDDVLRTDRAVAKIHQGVMKFGLTVYPESDPRIFAADKGRTKEELAYLIFDASDHPGYFETTDLHARVYRFYRK